MTLPKYFSQQELDRRRDVFSRVWHMEDIERPAFNIWINSKVPYSTKRFIDDPPYLMDYFMSAFEQRSKYKFDQPPVLYPWVGVPVIPSAYGCEIIITDENDPKSEPLLDKPEDVYKLEKPRLNTGLMAKMLEQLRYINEVNHGYYDIRMHDLQGPFSVASLIWGYEDFMAGVLTNPDEAHYLLKMVTETIIEFVELQRAIVPNMSLIHCPPEWGPTDIGIGVSDDIAAVVSPRIYEEFAVPYNNIISDYFGGIFTHSCGNSSFNFDSMLKQHNIRGVNFENGETPYKVAVEKLGGKVLIAPHVGIKLIPEFGSVFGYVKYMVENTPKGYPYIISICNTVFNDSTGKEMLDPSFDEAVEYINFLINRENGC